MREKLTARGGAGAASSGWTGGVNPVMVFNTPTMARGTVVGTNGEMRVGLFV